MLTAKDIQEIQFTKTMGGYKTAEVDEFLDECVATVEALYQQNEENNNKMQVLAETIMEYRNQEDSIRAALISAQRMADSVVKEANEKAASILSEAQNKADAIMEDAEENAELARQKTMMDIEAEQNELKRVRKEVSAFKARLMSVYREHLTMIGVLEGDDTPAEVSASEEIPAEEPIAPVEESIVQVEGPIAPVEEPVFNETPVAVEPDEEKLDSPETDMLDFSVFEFKDEE